MERVCEEFGCLPSHSIREWQTLPAGWLDEILEIRAFRRAVEAYRRAEQMDEGAEKNRILAHPLVQMVREIEFAPVVARHRQAQETHGG